MRLCVPLVLANKGRFAFALVGLRASGTGGSCAAPGFIISY
ncbi:hypothetical protein [Brucella pseudogrignonensis]